MLNGPLASLPKLLSVLPERLTLGMPQELGSSTLTGVPSFSLTLSTPASSWLILLKRELYPKRNSLILDDENTRVLASTHWLARVYRTVPFSLTPGVTVNSSVQL